MWVNLSMVDESFHQTHTSKRSHRLVRIFYRKVNHFGENLKHLKSGFLQFIQTFLTNLKILLHNSGLITTIETLGHIVLGKRPL